MKKETNRYFLSENAMKKYYEECLNRVGEGGASSWDIFVLINRKGYWDYRIFFPEGYKGNWNKDSDKKIISDRFLEKCPNDELEHLLKGKRVVIYDDSLTNGSNMFFYYLLCLRFGASRVDPVVYALHIEFPGENATKLMEREAKRIQDAVFWKKHSLKELLMDFEKSIQYKLLLDGEDINRMSEWQTKLFQEKLAPLVMDLPIINHWSGSNERSLNFTTEEFDKLINHQDSRWTFVKNETDVQGKKIVCSFFQMNSGFASTQMASVVHDMVVKCKYETKDDQVRVVFTPFAIVKSMTFKDALECFKVFYCGTSYAEKILKYFENSDAQTVMETDHNLCRAIFRSVIFQLSDYIGHSFLAYLEEVSGRKAEYDWDIMSDHFDREFILTQKQLGCKYSEEEFLRKADRCRISDDVEPLNPSIYSEKEERYASQERINIYVRERIIEKKRNINIGLEERIYTIETMITELERRFYFGSYSNKQKMITCTILLFLETNSFSNLIYVSNQDHILYRGFRYGENSEILLHVDLWFFYAYLYAFCNSAERGKLKEKYSAFMNWLKSVLKEKEYLGTWISADGFHFLREYFGILIKDEVLRMEMRRRRYLLDSTGNESEDSFRIPKIQEAAHVVKQWGRV